jgi:hypothetical protein
VKALEIELRDATMFRDGRPFAAELDASPRTLAWPWPSTLYGALRAHIGRSNAGAWSKMTDGAAEFGEAIAQVVGNRAELGSLTLRGPLLSAQRGPFDDPELAVPRPLDAEMFRDRGVGDLHVLPAEPVPGGALGPMADGQRVQVRRVAVVPREQLGKPLQDGHLAWWPWSAFERWLLDRSAEGGATGELSEWAKSRPKAARPGGPTATSARVHVSVERATQTALDGALFSTERLELSPAWEARMLAWVGGDGGLVQPGWLTLGGERGLARLEAPERSAPAWPAGLDAAIVSSRSFRLTALTPAVLGGGWFPRWLTVQGGKLRGRLPTRTASAAEVEVEVELEAACVGRPLAISGMSFGAGAAATERAAMRAAPAGSTWFFRIVGGQPTAAQVDTIRALWWDSLSDDPNDAKRGLGLCVVGSGLAAIEDAT